MERSQEHSWRKRDAHIWRRLVLTASVQDLMNVKVPKGENQSSYSRQRLRKRRGRGEEENSSGAPWRPAQFAENSVRSLFPRWSNSTSPHQLPGSPVPAATDSR
ncbi:unnamed protein product [Arctogadus glacialis]